MKEPRKYNPIVNEIYGADSLIEIYIPPRDDKEPINNSYIAQRLKHAFPDDDIEILVS